LPEFFVKIEQLRDLRSQRFYIGLDKNLPAGREMPRYCLNHLLIHHPSLGMSFLEPRIGKLDSYCLKDARGDSFKPRKPLRFANITNALPRRIC